jgi:3-dehydroquinate synthase
VSKVLTVSVDLGERSYDVLIGHDALASARNRLTDLFPRKRAIIITDSHIAPLHLDHLETELNGLGIKPEPFILDPGEKTKSFSQLESLIDVLLDHNVERSECIIAFGGGVIGDLVGFASAITKRGTGFIQIPTTLLSQVDSSVGGKTGINTRQGKNFVGAFHQPKLVIADSRFLDSLPIREQRAGYAEIVKAALIGDKAMFEQLETAGTSALTGDTLSQAIASSVAFKAKIVAQDEREGGVRALLNLGHTFGHAFEAEAPKDAIRHGEAVAAGIGLAFRYSVHLGKCPVQDALRVEQHLRDIGLPDGPKSLAFNTWNAERLVERMRGDKKNSGGNIMLVLVNGIGNAYLDTTTDENNLVNFMETTL